MSTNRERRAVIYARISVTSEESVSIERQVEAAEQYAAARGWQVVGTFRDDGVSATHNKPEDRAGWQALMRSPTRYDAVIVWKVDRLARRVLDFLHADEALQARGAGIVGVEQTIDMTTAEGRGFAQMLAVFGEMEAAAISARVKAARSHLVRSGRVVGGTIPYGWRSVPNPDGPGYVLAQDPERIGYVREAARRTLAGRSVYSTVQWLDEVGAPTPTGKGDWVYSTVERILRHPVLAGMTPFNPGNSDTKIRGNEVLRDAATGLPLVDEDLAVMPKRDWDTMIALLDNRDTAQSKPRALRAKTSGMLSGLVYCGEHDEPVRMWRGTIQRRPGYYCPDCSHAISNFEDAVVREFLRQKGDRVRWTVVHEAVEGGAVELAELERTIRDLQATQNATDDDAEYDRLAEQIKALRELRRQARDMPTRVEPVYTPANYFVEDWAAATTDEDKRDVVGDALHRITITRGKPGRRTEAQLLARMSFEWKVPEDLGPTDAPDDETLASWAV